MPEFSNMLPKIEVSNIQARPQGGRRRETQPYVALSALLTEVNMRVLSVGSFNPKQGYALDDSGGYLRSRTNGYTG